MQPLVSPSAPVSAAVPAPPAHGRAQRLAALPPGLLLATVVTLAAAWAAQAAGGSTLVYALVLGVALHWAADDPRAGPGLAWAAGPLLRLGVGLLGVRLSVAHLAQLGWAPVLLTLGVMASTVALGLLGARWLRLPWTVGLLAGGANAICGASATLALSSVLPRHDPHRLRHTAVVAASATALSVIAMFLYPWLARVLGLDAVQTGLFLGGSIQDVAQVVAAGYAHSHEAGDAAITLKLARVMLLGPITAGVAWGAQAWQARTQPGVADGAVRSRRAWMPAFVWLFVALLALNSTGVVAPAVQTALVNTSQACITVAMAALGMRLSLRELAQTGWRTFALLGGLAAWVAAVMATGLMSGL